MLEKFKDLIENLKQEAKESFQRRIVVIQGDTEKKMELAAEIANYFFLESPEVNLLYLGDNISENAFAYKRFLRFKETLESKFNVKRVEFRKTEKVLGTTFDALVIDASQDFRADDLGRTVETVRGGGLILLLTPPFELWKRMWLGIHRSFITPPYQLSDIKHLFIPRVIRKLQEHPGIVILDADAGKVVKPINWTRAPAYIPKRPQSSELPKEILEIVRTQDQADAVARLKAFMESEIKAFILISDRGRGKTSSLGIAAAYLVASNLIKKRIVITAPEFINVAPFFDFLKLTLDKLGIKYKYPKTGVVKLKHNGHKIVIEYRSMLRLLERYRPSEIDLVIVDEAASFPTTLLFRSLEKFGKLVYSSTIHGYEGAGRGFSVRFLGRLKKQKLASFEEFRMSEPIRYAPGDFVESWLYDTLLLDAEPEQLDAEDIQDIDKLNLEFEHPDLKNWFLRNDRDLRAYFGIYILAHYRNSPLDLQLLADAPHHDAFVTRTKTKRKIVNAIQVAYEGGLSKEIGEKIIKGYDPSGNLIPCKIAQNFQDPRFPSYRGIRIVRIATHPDYQGRGIGSKALAFLEAYAKEHGFDWIGSGFGATPELLRFWFRNGYLPVHMSPLKQVSSGEYSTVVIKPLNEKLRETLIYYSFVFKLRFMDSLLDAHRTLEPETALELLKYSPYPRDFLESRGPRLLMGELKEIQAFINEATSYETIYGPIRKLVKIYFLDPKRPRLDELTQKLLVVKILQNRKWNEAKKELGISRRAMVKRIREVMRKLLETYEYLVV
jgi:tRNA(Met) cytidine acetyltransferase